MAAIKTVTMTVRVAPAVKQGLKTAAEQEHRSIANMVAVMIRDYCGREGIAISGLGTVVDAGHKPVKRAK